MEHLAQGPSGRQIEQARKPLLVLATSIASFFQLPLPDYGRLPSPRSRRSETCLLGVLSASSVEIQHRRPSFFLPPLLLPLPLFLLQLASESLRVIVAEGPSSSASSASSASTIVLVHGGYIHLITYFHLRKLARLLWPPFFAPGPQRV